MRADDTGYRKKFELILSGNPPWLRGTRNWNKHAGYAAALDFAFDAWLLERLDELSAGLGSRFGSTPSRPG
jgi:hypothetical protein